MLPASIIASYCLKIIFDLSANQVLGFADGGEKYYVALIVFSIVIGYILGLLSTLKATNVILMKLGIIQNFNENIWIDIYNAGGWFEVHKKDMGYSYYGRISAIEGETKEPIIVMKDYELVYPMTIDTYSGIEPIVLTDGTVESIAIKTDDIEYIKIYNTTKTKPKKRS